MLFILTGDVRTGKTTWLEARVRELEAAGVPVRGVLAPGVWRDGEKVVVCDEEGTILGLGEISDGLLKLKTRL